MFWLALLVVSVLAFLVGLFHPVVMLVLVLSSLVGRFLLPKDSFPA